MIYNGLLATVLKEEYYIFQNIYQSYNHKQHMYKACTAIQNYRHLMEDIRKMLRESLSQITSNVSTWSLNLAYIIHHMRLMSHHTTAMNIIFCIPGDEIATKAYNEKRIVCRLCSSKKMSLSCEDRYKSLSDAGLLAWSLYSSPAV